MALMSPQAASAAALHPPLLVSSCSQPWQKAGQASVKRAITSLATMSWNFCSIRFPRMVGEWLQGRRLPRGSRL